MQRFLSINQQLSAPARQEVSLQKIHFFRKLSSNKKKIYAKKLPNLFLLAYKNEKCKQTKMLKESASRLKREKKWMIKRCILDDWHSI
jgi:hypothetical protein